ncbi:hypothetical protein P4B35_13760 [Pontiellaceae bacterium B12227]|nr:hypothetical protein [Pontiellaceae bacterium B12227]
MKKLMTLAVLLSAVAFAQAAESEQKGKGQRGPRGPVTEEQFVARGQARAEKQGVEFDEAAAKAKFAELDVNGDGELSKEEAPKRKGKGPKGQKGDKKGGEKPAE